MVRTISPLNQQAITTKFFPGLFFRLAQNMLLSLVETGGEQ